jgi:hypothetical protein
MINQILREIQNSENAFSLSDLSQKLNIDPAALEGILAYCVQKGRLLENGKETFEQGSTCASGGCGSSCHGIDSCAFIARMPRIYSITNISNGPSVSEKSTTSVKRMTHGQSR